MTHRQNLNKATATEDGGRYNNPGYKPLKLTPQQISEMQELVRQHESMQGNHQIPPVHSSWRPPQNQINLPGPFTFPPPQKQNQQNGSFPPPPMARQEQEIRAHQMTFPPNMQPRGQVTQENAPLLAKMLQQKSRQILPQPPQIPNQMSSLTHQPPLIPNQHPQEMNNFQAMPNQNMPHHMSHESFRMNHPGPEMYRQGENLPPIWNQHPGSNQRRMNNYSQMLPNMPDNSPLLHQKKKRVGKKKHLLLTPPILQHVQMQNQPPNYDFRSQQPLNCNLPRGIPHGQNQPPSCNFSAGMPHRQNQPPSFHLPPGMPHGQNQPPNVNFPAGMPHGQNQPPNVNFPAGMPHGENQPPSGNFTAGIPHGQNQPPNVNFPAGMPHGENQPPSGNFSAGIPHGQNQPPSGNFSAGIPHGQNQPPSFHLPFGVQHGQQKPPNFHLVPPGIPPQMMQGNFRGAGNFNASDAMRHAGHPLHPQMRTLFMPPLNETPQNISNKFRDMRLPTVDLEKSNTTRREDVREMIAVPSCALTKKTLREKRLVPQVPQSKTEQPRYNNFSIASIMGVSNKSDKDTTKQNLIICEVPKYPEALSKPAEQAKSVPLESNAQPQSTKVPPKLPVESSQPSTVEQSKKNNNVAAQHEIYDLTTGPPPLMKAPFKKNLRVNAPPPERTVVSVDHTPQALKIADIPVPPNTKCDTPPQNVCSVSKNGISSIVVPANEQIKDKPQTGPFFVNQNGYLPSNGSYNLQNASISVPKNGQINDITQTSPLFITQNGSCVPNKPQNDSLSVPRNGPINATPLSSQSSAPQSGIMQSDVNGTINELARNDRNGIESYIGSSTELVSGSSDNLTLSEPRSQMGPEMTLPELRSQMGPEMTQQDPSCLEKNKNPTVEVQKLDTPNTTPEMGTKIATGVINLLDKNNREKINFKIPTKESPVIVPDFSINSTIFTKSKKNKTGNIHDCVERMYANHAQKSGHNLEPVSSTQSADFMNYENRSVDSNLEKSSSANEDQIMEHTAPIRSPDVGSVPSSSTHLKISTVDPDPVPSTSTGTSKSIATIHVPCYEDISPPLSPEPSYPGLLCPKPSASEPSCPKPLGSEPSDPEPWCPESSESLSLPEPSMILNLARRKRANDEDRDTQMPRKMPTRGTQDVWMGCQLRDNFHVSLEGNRTSSNVSSGRKKFYTPKINLQDYESPRLDVTGTSLQPEVCHPVPEASNPEAAYSEAANPEAANPEAANPEAANPEAAFLPESVVPSTPEQVKLTAKLINDLLVAEKNLNEQQKEVKKFQTVCSILKEEKRKLEVQHEQNEIQRQKIEADIEIVKNSSLEQIAEFEKQLDKKCFQFILKESELKKVTNELNEKKKQLAIEQRERERVVSNFFDKDRELREFKAERDNLTLAKQIRNGYIACLCSEINTLNTQKLDLEKELELASNRIRLVSAECEKAKRKIESLELSLEAEKQNSSKNIKRMESDLGVKKSKIVALESIYKRLSKKLVTALKKVNKLKKRLQERKMAAKNESDDYQKKLKLLSNEHIKFANQLSELEGFKVKNKTQNDTIKKLNNKIKVTKERIKDEKMKHEDEYKSFNSIISKQNGKLQSLKKEMTKNENKMKNINSELRSTLAKSRAQNKEWRKKCKQLQEQLQQKQLKITAVEKEKSEILKYLYEKIAEIWKMKAIVKDLKEELIEKDNKVKQSETELSLKEKEITNLKNSVDEKEKVFKTVREQLDELKQEHEKFVIKVKDDYISKDEMLEKQRRLEQSHIEDIEYLRNQEINLDNKLEEKVTKLEEVKGEKRKLEEDLEETKTKLQRTQEDLNVLIFKHKLLFQHNLSADKENSTLKKKLKKIKGNGK